MSVRKILVPVSLSLGLFALAGCSNMMGNPPPPPPPAPTQSGMQSPVGGMGPAAAAGGVSGQGSGNITAKPAAGTAQ